MTPIVVDAGVLAAALAQDSVFGDNAQAALRGYAWHVPTHGPLEALAVLRKWARDGTIPAARADNVAAMLGHVVMTVHPLGPPQAARIWELRHNVAPYDAAYVALAEQLDCPVVTTDERLSNAPGPTCPIVVVPRSLSRPRPVLP